MFHFLGCWGFFKLCHHEAGLNQFTCLHDILYRFSCITLEYNINKDDVSKYINWICRENKVLFYQFGELSFFEDTLGEINCQHII